MKLPWPIYALIFLVALLIWWVVSSQSQLVEKSKSDWKVQQIDGCDYIVMTSTTYYGYSVLSITHKGDCPNPLHK